MTSDDVCQASEGSLEWSGKLQNEMRVFGYSSHGKYNSMSLLRAAELCEDQATYSPSARVTSKATLRSQASRKFKELVRQLPPQACIDILVHTFFSEINWQYDLLDEELFRDNLAAWRKITYYNLQAEFETLPFETIVFPALLFQVLAQALLYHPADEMIGSLITIPDMTFHDLGSEYSDAGADLLMILGKEDITIAMAQAGLLRAAFLKSSGKVVEAWHVLGTAIRNAQEIGLHTGMAIPGQNLMESTVSRDRAIFIGHKVWVVLHIWDVHMAVVLGRPIATDLQIDHFASTIEDERLRQQLFLHWQTESDLPRPFDVIIAGYNVAYRYFKDIHQLENRGGNLEDYPTVELLDASIRKNLELLPSWCRLENPDTKFDQLTDCLWLPAARDVLSSLIHLVVLALHRPFIFSVASSRAKALEAGVSILNAQERLFERTEPRQRKVFNPVYASFDAIVLIAAICITFPNEDHEKQTGCITILEKGMERLNIIGQSNSVARSAHDIVCGLYRRLRHRLDIFKSSEGVTALLTDPIGMLTNGDVDPARGDPLEFPFDAISPPRPTHDLFVDHLSMTSLPFTATQPNFSLGPQIPEITGTWDFQGDFSDASFWSFMNEFNH